MVLRNMGALLFLFLDVLSHPACQSGEPPAGFTYRSQKDRPKIVRLSKMSPGAVA
jgi:hypothetical protein